MLRPQTVIRWLLQAGTLPSMPSWFLETNYRGDRTLHHSVQCGTNKPNGHGPAEFTIEEFDEYELCRRCAPLALGERGDDLVQSTWAAFTAISHLQAAEDFSHLPLAESYPLMRGERVHQIVDQTLRQAKSGVFGPPGSALTVGMLSVANDVAKNHRRGKRTQLMAEATRLFSISEVCTRYRNVPVEVVKALHRGDDPETVLALSEPGPERTKVGEIIDSVETTMLEARPEFVLLMNYPSTLYGPLRSFGEIITAAGARFSKSGRVMGELPDVVCRALTLSSGNRARHVWPARLDGQWADVEDDVLETALDLWKSARTGDIWSSLSGALEIAIALT